MYNFLYPLWFFLLLLIPVLVFYELYALKKIVPKIVFSNLSLVRSIVHKDSVWKYIPLILKCLLVLFIAIALARPRFTTERREYTTYGVDIALSIDVSGSMQAMDFKPRNRMEVTKSVALDFINKRESDRFAIVTFATYAYTLVPLTNDFNVLNTVVSQIKVDEYQSSTAIGNGLAIAVARLKDSPAKSKIIILVSDGVNNAGQIDPITAAELARTFDIKIYTVGIGSKGLVDFPYQHPLFGTQYRKVNVDFDIDGLNEIAKIGGTGRVHVARNTQELQEIFREIDELEKTEIVANVYYEQKEMFVYFLYIAVAVLLCLILVNTVVRFSLP